MDQAEGLRELMAHAHDDRARVIAVSSGKGGVGKTNICVNLAIALASMGRRVVLVDVDIGLANADVVLGVKPEFDLRHVLVGEVDVQSALTEAPGDIRLLAGSAGVRTVSDLDKSQRGFLVSCFEELTYSNDFVLIDTGAGITRNVIDFAAAADEVLVVTTPEPPAMTDGYALIKTVSREKGYGRIRLVCNQAFGRLEAGRVCGRIREVCLRFLDLEVEYLGYVLSDQSVGRAVRRRHPFVLEYPNCPASDCVLTLAERLVDAPERVGVPSFANRLVSMSQGD
jgi:flagellar biosynthesis protein FlhG